MAVNLKQAKYYFNRELSWTLFNQRVLEEAMDEHHPLLERLKFISIFSSNLDEFFMIRVAGLKEQIHAGIHELPIDGHTPEECIMRISERVHQDAAQQARTLHEDILPKLRRHGVRIRYYSKLTADQKEFLKQHFKEKIFPVLTPLAIDPAHPFPQLRNLGLNLLVEVKTPYKKNEKKLAVVPVPALLPRFIKLPGKNPYDFILIEDVIKEHMDVLFQNMKVLSVTEFRITRNADLDLSEAEADDLLKLIERELRKRRLGTVIRLEVSENMSAENRYYLKKLTGLREMDIYDIPGYLDLASFMELMSVDLPDLKDAKFTPSLSGQITNSPDIFEAIEKSDVLLHHPFDSFNHVVDLISEAANDPCVLAIKQTLYRTSGKSPIVAALKKAVEKGKQVTALIELKARFDEETNIVWAKELERSGVNVIYGVLGLKTHCKLLMIVRRENDTLRQYLHMSTGNYNAKTAKLYTDIGFLTCDQDMGKDASELFNYLTGYSGQQEWRKMFVAPINLRSNLYKLFQQTIQHHSAENPSRIMMVMNSLVDPGMIQYLYKASQAGIEVDLIVRGICCLRPGVKGVSENIRVRSIVGRFLEHTRIYHFHYSGKSHVYIGSADLMQRNLNRRMEVLFPIEKRELKQRLIQITETQLRDTAQARELQTDGTYVRVKPEEGQEPFNSQDFFLNIAHERTLQIDTIS